MLETEGHEVYEDHMKQSLKISQYEVKCFTYFQWALEDNTWIGILCNTER